MTKHTSVEKLSKKQRKAYYAKRRGTWDGLSPVTRVPPDPKAYVRRKRIKQTDE
ncbi:MAG: hypothetical protein LBJ84_02205 [Oscillospiraceae bacterium]|nr:hypothetical protein [Oscillospiraceae bacterium]